MSVYSNNVNLHMNELAILEFRENSQNGIVVVSSVAITYDFLKTFHQMLGDVIEQQDKKLHELKRTKDNMN